MSYSRGYSQAILVVVYVADKIRQELYEHVPTHAIAASLGIPTPTTAKILHALARAGIVETREGSKGGVRLAVAANKVTFSDVFDALENRRPLFQTHTNVRAKGERPTRAQRAIREALGEAERSMRARHAETTIQDILDRVVSH